MPEGPRGRRRDGKAIHYCGAQAQAIHQAGRLEAPEEADMMWQVILVAYGVFMLWEASTGWQAVHTRTFETLAGLLLMAAGAQQGVAALRNK